ncbi:MAG TPA: hypothetical protein PK657_03480 [Legionella sp.]|nr:hypothetical protein [Legionella sp.]
MLSEKELSTLNAIYWYFGVLLGKSRLNHDTENSKILGALIEELPKFYTDMAFVCKLNNGETGLTPEKEYEYVGRGFVDPFYRLTHNNDDCYFYVQDTLEEVEKSDFSSIEKKRNLGIGVDIDGINALLPLIILIMSHHKVLLKNAGIHLESIDISSITGRGDIACLSQSDRITLGGKLLNREQQIQIHDTLDHFINIKMNSNNNLSMNILNGFIFCLGVATVALAFTVFHFATAGTGLIISTLGACLMGGSLGFFISHYENTQKAEEHSFGFSP